MLGNLGIQYRVCILAFLEDTRIAGSKKEVRRNRDITSREVRLIDAEGGQVGIVTNRRAQELAEDAGLDLVEIQPNAEPPVCKIMDFGRFKFEAQKRASEAKKKQKQVQIKEIKFRPGTEEGDYQVKLRKLTEFLEGGDKVKITLRFRGREMAHREMSAELLKRVREDLDELGQVEQHPSMEGRQMTMVIAPRRR